DPRSRNPKQRQALPAAAEQDCQVSRQEEEVRVANPVARRLTRADSFSNSGAGILNSTHLRHASLQPRNPHLTTDFSLSCENCALKLPPFFRWHALCFSSRPASIGATEGSGKRTRHGANRTQEE